MSLDTGVLEHSAMGVYNMSKYMPSAIRMADTNVVEALCSKYKEDNA